MLVPQVEIIACSQCFRWTSLSWVLSCSFILSTIPEVFPRKDARKHLLQRKAHVYTLKPSLRKQPQAKLQSEACRGKPLVWLTIASSQVRDIYELALPEDFLGFKSWELELSPFREARSQWRCLCWPVGSPGPAWEALPGLADGRGEKPVKGQGGQGQENGPALRTQANPLPLSLLACKCPLHPCRGEVCASESVGQGAALSSLTSTPWVRF